jgi:DNA primase
MESVERWRLGYAPQGWENFLKVAGGRGYGPETLVKAGLCIPRQGAPGHYDRFRDRLIFPIQDVTGRTIAFGARALKAGDEPKYLNSPETPLFSKGRSFYGLSEAREAIRSSGMVAILEGYTDVIMAHQGGVREAVAVLGTALTSDHARALARLCERVVLVFDPDEAGRNSALRSIEVLLAEDMEIRVAELPDGQDPCDFILRNGGEAFRLRLEDSVDFFEFRLGVAQAEHDTSSVSGRAAAFRDVAQMALAVTDEARRDMLVRWAAGELGISEQSAWAHVQRNWRGKLRRGGAVGDPGYSETPLSATRALPGQLLGLLLLHPELLPEADARVHLELLRDCPERAALELMLQMSRDGVFDGPGPFVAGLREAEMAAAASGALSEERERETRITAADPQQRLEGYILYLEEAGSPGVGAVDLTDDEKLKELQRRFRERDRRASQSR